MDLDLLMSKLDKYHMDNLSSGLNHIFRIEHSAAMLMAHHLMHKSRGIVREDFRPSTVLSVYQRPTTCYFQEGGGVSRVNIDRLITTSVTSRHTSMFFKMAGNFLDPYFCKS